MPNNNQYIITSLLLIFTMFVVQDAFAQDNGEEWLQKGNELYESGNKETAAEYYLKAAEQNIPEAQFYTGYALYHGEGVTKDYSSAAMWFKRAAYHGLPKAEYNLAFCYMEGKGVPRDYEKAFLWLKKSAEHEYVQAQLTLAEGYEKGILVEQDLQKSQYWQERAANNGKDIACIPKEKEKNPVDTIILDNQQAKLSQKIPTLKILYPEDQSFFHTNIIKVKYQLQAYGYENETNVTAIVDGKRQADTRAVRQANMLDVEVPDHDCTVILYAQNKMGNSEPAMIRLIRENAAQAELPRLFAVVIGVGKYEDPKLPSLKLTTKDARDFGNAVLRKKGLPFSDVQVKILCDEEATRADFFEALEWLQQEATPNDICIFYYAGHGYRDEKDRFYFIPFQGTTDKLYNCFSATDFKNMADDINSKLIVFTDACYSAALFEGNRSAATTHFLEQLRRAKNGTMLYASSASDTKSKEDSSWGNGAFTKALVEAFNGAARQLDEEGLSTQSLEMYLYKQVRKITDYKQTPIFINPNGIEHFNIFTYDK